MFLKKTSVLSEGHSMSPIPITQSLRILRSVARREAPCSERRPHQAPHSLSKSALATSCYSRKTAVPSLSGFAPEMEALRKAFLMRPGCPQFSTRATSMSHLGSGSSIHPPRVLGSRSKSQRGMEDWLLDRQDSDQSSEGRPLLGSKSDCQLSTQRKSTSQTLSPVCSWGGTDQRLPWYIAVIQEKDRSLLALGEEVQRFSKLETQVQKKDQEIQMLQREMEALQKQLKCIIRNKGLKTPERPSWRMQGEDSPAELGRALSLELGSDEEDQGPGPEPKGAGDGAAGGTGAVQQEGAEEEEEKELEEEDEEELPQEGGGSWGQAFSVTESLEDELLAQLEEYERTLLEFQDELEAIGIRFCLATGTIASLQRQLTFQESQMQKVNMENEALQKELRERKQQLQAMSDKFSRLREDKKHREVMGLIEKDNLSLRQCVSDLEWQLAKRDGAIAELIAKVSALQAQFGLEQEHVQWWRQLQEDVRGRNESMQQAELQARVALESTQARLERLRSKIMQAAFSVTGVEALAAEISDNDILEALQRIILERNDYYHQLKQTGAKVPPPQQVEIPPSKSKKTLSK
ncbi:Coiled-coil domain-containing protein 27 [Heterocephalus glaber]|uniref:Coiled-coil domain-containing protein 27 n=1 Tax=Heterocephalus glaber TaxID=10181 RepID=G5CBI5_HETGA|nr:Coiled-coil domain-containing protein 27 [Heterocephalus glaber]